MLGQSWFLAMAVIGQNCAARLGNRVYATNFALTFLPSLITNFNIAKGLYPATDKNTAMESLWVGKGIDFICTPFQVCQACVCCILWIGIEGRVA
jgi:hypothetical protein